jgi:hypothetical protein
MLVFPIERERRRGNDADLVNRRIADAVPREFPQTERLVLCGGHDGANLLFTSTDTFDEAKNTITELGFNFITKISEYSKNFGGFEMYICNNIVWIYPQEPLPTTHYYAIEAWGWNDIFLGGTDENGDIIIPSANPCNNINNEDGSNENVESGGLPDLTNLLVEWNDNYETNFLYFYHNNSKIYWQTSSNHITDDEKVFGMEYSINEETNTITITSSNNTIELVFLQNLIIIV